MRTLAHSIDAAAVQRQLDRARAAVESDLDKSKDAEARRNAFFFRNYVTNGLKMARAGYLYDFSPPEVKAAIHKALSQVPKIIEIDGAVSPLEMRKYLGAALVAGDSRLLKWLAQLPEENYTLPAIEISRAGYILIHALQAGALGDRDRFDRFQKEFAANISPGKLKVNPRSEAQILEPLALLLAAISAHDQSAFDKAWKAQAAAWKSRWGRAEEKANNEGILDFAALGIGKIAQKFGLHVSDTNSYAPLELLSDENGS